jgi:hypothetical protein
MTSQQLWIWLGATALLTLVAIVIAATLDNQPLAVLAGAMFLVVVSIVGWRFAGLASRNDPAAVVSARYARLIGVTWTWSGATMLAAYYLTDLSWQHAWQYGLAMLLIAALLFHYAGLRTNEASPFAREPLVMSARWLTGLQGVAAVAGVIILTLSGKLQAGKQDWAANIIFIAGGLAIFTLSMSALRGEQRAMRNSPPPA